MKRYCCSCGDRKQAKFFAEDHFYCKSCENKNPDLKKWRKVNGQVVKK